MRISDWSSDVCSSDLFEAPGNGFIVDAESPRHGYRRRDILRIVGPLQRGPARLVLDVRGGNENTLAARLGSDGAGVIVLGGDDGDIFRRLHQEQPRLGGGVTIDAIIAVEMVRRAVEQHGDRKSTRRNSSHKCEYRIPSPTCKHNI